MICEVIMGKQIAKYKEIEHDILTQIQNGKLQTGDQILTENELCSRYQVSRMTARKALDLLSSKGILTRAPGKGTFVNSIQIAKTSNETRSCLLYTSSRATETPNPPTIPSQKSPLSSLFLLLNLLIPFISFPLTP